MTAPTLEWPLREAARRRQLSPGLVRTAERSEADSVVTGDLPLLVTTEEVASILWTPRKGTGATSAGRSIGRNPKHRVLPEWLVLIFMRGRPRRDW